MEYLSKNSGNPFLYKTMLNHLQHTLKLKVSGFEGQFVMSVEPGTGCQIWSPIWREILVYFTDGTSLIVTQTQSEWFPPTKLNLSPPLMKKVKSFVINEELDVISEDC